MNANKTVALWTRRSILSKGVLGSAAGLVLAACGGGGGDSSSGGVQALRDAFAKLHDGMTTSEVEALVGFSANDLRSDADLRWVVNGVTLVVGFYSISHLIERAKLTESDGVTNQFRLFS